MSDKTEKAAKPGKIAEARAAVDFIQAEIDDLREKLKRNRLELARLSGHGAQRDPDSVARAEALRVVLDNLQHDLPIENWQPGDRRPLLQARLERAEDDLKAAYHARANLSLSLLDTELTKLAWGDLLPAEAETLVQKLLPTFGRVGFPAGTNERTWQAIRTWLRQTQSDLDSLSRLWSMLADYGPDPEFAEGEPWSRPRATLARECLDYDRLESLRNRISRARAMTHYQSPADLDRLAELESWLDRLEDGQFLDE